MARSKHWLTVYVEYSLVRALFALLMWVPFSFAKALAHGTLKIVMFLMPKRHGLMLTNIQASFPEKDLKKCQKIADESIENLAKGIAVFVRMPGYLHEKQLDWLHFEGLEHLDKSLAAGHGAMAFTAHYGCWELMSAWTMKQYPKVCAVYRAMDNPRIDEFVKQVRSSEGGIMVERRDILKHSLKWLKQNGLIGFLVDQNFAAGGAYVNFFGRLAATTPALSLLARRTGAAIHPVHNYWDKGHVRVVWEKALPLSQNPDPERAMHEDTQAMTTIVERWIREDPGQWMWLHNRWKRQPLK